jgi:hypothetical protein
MNCDNATKSNRKSGVAQWRDPLFIIRMIESEWKRRRPLCHPERSRGICSSVDLSWKCFSTEGATELSPLTLRIPNKIVIPTGA